MLELAILGLLKELPLHGYELKKRLNDRNHPLGHFFGVSYGSLYPALARLEKVGAIEAVDPQPGTPANMATIPATGSISGEAAAARLRRRPLARSGRTRKAYRIAARGQALFSELILADPAPAADDDRSFALKLAFCRHLEPSARLHLLQRRRAVLSGKLAKGREALSEITRMGPRADRYTRALVAHETSSAERDLEWVDALITEEELDLTVPTVPAGGNP